MRDLLGDTWPSPEPEKAKQKSIFDARSATSHQPHSEHIPLAERLRPQKLSDVVGQQHLIGPQQPLLRMIETGHLHSMILWGPPGVGKTTLARLLAQAVDGEFLALSAVFSGVKDIRLAIEQAQNWQQQGRRSTLFVDEIHRFNKSQQDALLPYVESGLVTFIGATTENPSFEVNSALLSRAQVYVLHALNETDLQALMTNALAATGLQLEDAAHRVLIAAADGDARRLLNILDRLCSMRTSADQVISVTQAEQWLGQRLRRFDKGADEFYDQISALHKSVRGSNPDAALYWFCRMLDGGTDPRYLARRIIRIAWEDVGLADPRAMQICNDAAQTYERLGSPEGELALSQALLYLAVAAKSNAGYNAYNQAKAFVKQDKSREVPMHLRNAPTQLMKQLGHGHAYKYAHDEPHAYAAGETYLPDGIDAPNWYKPVPRGLEIKIAEKLDLLRKWDDEAGNK